MSNSDLVLKQTYRNMLSLSNNIESYSNNTLFLGHLSIASNLYISGLSNIIGNTSFISNLNISNTSNLNNITTFGNFYISATSNLYNLSVNSTLLANNTTLINNTNILGNLNISNNAIINNITVNNNLYVSNISLLNKTTINSTLQATNALLNLNSSINSNLYVSNLSIINVNLTSNSNLFVSNTTILQNNVNSNNLYTLNLNINQNMTNLSDIEISGNSYFNKDITVYKNMTVSNTLLISGLSTFNNLNITGTTTTILPEYSDNLTASNANVPLWGFYRTGGILKIRIDTLAPVMSGNTSISIFKGSVLTDPGVSVIDNLNEIIIPNITSINYSGYNYLSSPIPISGPMTITSFNSLLVGYHTITYTASDSYNNISNIYRTVNVITSPSTLNINLNGSDVVKMKVGTTYTEQNVILNTIQNIPYYNLSSPNLTYLYINNRNYNSLASNNWTIECYVNIPSYVTSQSSGVVLDFRTLPYNGNVNIFCITITNTGQLCVFHSIYGFISYPYNNTTYVKLNQWTHIVYQKNGNNIECYINGILAGNINISGKFTTADLTDLNQLSLGMANDWSTNAINWHFLGSISQVKISIGIKYNGNFTPNKFLYPLSNELSSTLFFLNDNYTDIISNIVMNYGTNPAPVISYNTIILNSSITLPTNIIGTVNNNQIGKYVLSYLTIDIFGNISNTLYRTVYVLDTLTINAYNITNSYLYLANNYNILTTSLFWTIEGWFNITSLSNNGCTIIDFRDKPYTSNTGKIAFLINSSGYLGMYYESTLTFTSITTIPLNTWNHIAIQKNGIYFEFYLNGTFVGQIAFNGTLSNFNQLTLGMKNDLSNTDVNYHFKGSISQVKITPYLVYLTSFYPSYILSSTDAIFFLGDNLKDTITNTTLTYNNIPTNILREYFVNLPVSNLESRNLVFNLECKNLIVSNVSPTSLTWTDSTNNYQFICHPNANTISSLSKIQNNNGWKRTNNIAWTMSDTSNTLFKSLNWTFGLSLEQWIYIDYDFVPSSTNMLLVGQSSLFNTNDYGFCFTSSSFPYNVLSFATSSVITNQGNGMGGINFRALVGKWTHLCATINSTNKILKLYVNGGLLISLDSSNWTVWCDPASSTSKFTIGCNSNNGTIQSESLNKVHFGNTRVYSRILDQYEVYNNYSYESSLYQITNGITYNSPISWSFNGGISTIYTNEYIQTFNIETNKYIFKNYSVNTNSVYKISFNAKLITATNLCISITNSSGTFNTVGGYQMTSINSGLNTNNFIKFEYIFETKSLSSVNIYIGNHNQSDIGSQSLGTFSIFDFNLNIYNIIQSDVLTLSNITTPIDWVRPDGISTSIITNDNLTTLYLDNKAYYTTLSLTPNTAYIISFWIKFGTATNFCIALRNGATWNIGGYEGTGIKNGINTNTFTLVSYIFDSKNYTSLNLYIGQHSNSMTAQTTGTVIIGDFKILPITINSNISVYNPISSINFIKSPNTIALDPITNYDMTLGWITQTMDFNILRLVPSWTIETWVYPTTIDTNYIFDFSSGSNSLILGITSSVSNITPSISSDGYGRPFIYYSGDTISQWKIKATPKIILNTWTHIAYVKNNDTQLEMYVNGVSTGTFTIALNDWRYPNFMNNTLINSLMLGASKSNPSSTTNHLKGKISQPKITLGRKYTSSFNPAFDLSLNDNGLFLLQDNFVNNAIGKSVTNNSATIPTFSLPTISLNGSNSITLFQNMDTYTELGYVYSYYTRSNSLKLFTNGIVDTTIINNNVLVYGIMDSLNNINYVKKNVNVIKYNILPVITLIGPSIMYLGINKNYYELGVNITNNLNQTINPVIVSNLNNSQTGIYTITYYATDMYDNTASITRTINIVNQLQLTSYVLNTGALSINNNYNSLNNNNWTIEAWFYPTQPTNMIDGIVLFDFRPYPWTTNNPFTITIKPDLTPGIWSYYINNWYGSSSFKISYNTWQHIAVMRSGTSVYIFLNGVPNLLGTGATWINNISGANSLYIGCDNYYMTQNGITNTRNKYYGEICQPLITLSARYNVSGFTPKWDLTPDSMTNVLFLLYNNIDIISNKPVNFINTVTYYTLNTSPILPVINIPRNTYTLNDLIGKTAGTYPIKCTDGNVRNYYWDGTYLVIYKEQLDANSYTSNWSNTTTQYMSNFGDMGTGYAHGYTPNSTYTLTINNILVSGYDKAKYEVKIHYVDSTDQENNYIYINNFNNQGRTLIWQSAKYHPNNPIITNYENTTTIWSGRVNYSYAPAYGNNNPIALNGYNTVTSKEFNFNSSSLSIEHIIGVDQEIQNEALYISHSTLYLKPDNTGTSSTSIPLNSIYTDPGVSVSYVFNPYLIAYIVSIKDNYNNELLSSQLNALNNNILSVIDTTILNKTYTITYKVTDEYERNVFAIKNITIVLAYNIYNLLDKTAGTYPIICTDTQIRNYYWDGTYLVIYKEQLDANSYTSNWSNTTTQYMSDFGGLGSGYAHGYTPNTTYTLTINIPISGYDKAKYEVKIHYIDSWDGENNYIYINNFDNRGRILVWQSSKVYTNSPSITNYENNITQWSGYVNYSYRPLGMQNQSYSITNGYNTITTKEFNYSSSSITIEHQTQLNQDITDEAFYVSHSTLYLKPIVPVITINGNSNTYISLNSTYTDLGVSISYSLNPSIIAYIVSVKDDNNNELLSTQLNALNGNILSLNTSILNKTYTVKYRVTDQYNNIIEAIRTVIVVKLYDISYNLNSGYLGPLLGSVSGIDYTRLWKSDSTFEAWINVSQYPTTANGNAGVIIDFRNAAYGSVGIVNNNSSTIYIDPNGKLCIWRSGNFTIFQDNIIPLNKWTHIVIMRYNNNFYTFINGVISSPVSAASWTNLSNNTAISLGLCADYSYNNGNPYIYGKYLGSINQASVMLGAKYTINNFTPSSNLAPNSFTSNNYFFLGSNGNDLISGINMTNTNVSISIISPTIILNGISNTYILLNSTYTDLGVIVSYFINPTIIAYIVSINNQVLSPPLNALNTNVLSLDTSILNTAYTIKYRVTDEYNRIIEATRIVTINNIPINDIFFWIDPSTNSLTDKSNNNITMIPYTGTPTIKSNGIKNLSVIDFTNSSSLISSSKIMNSYNVTLAIIVTFFQNTNWGVIWGHFNNHDYDIVLRNTSGGNFINWHTNDDNSIVQIAYPSYGTPVLYLGTLTNGTNRFFKMINLLTGAITTVSGTNPLTMILRQNNIYLGSSEVNELALCYVGECMYWNRVLTSTEQDQIISYLYSKWS